MKLSLLLPLFLLGIALARHLKNNKAQTDLSQDLKFSGEKKGELVLHEEAIPSEEEELKGSGDQDSFEDEYLGDDVDSGLAVPKGFQCPKEDDIVRISVTPEGKTRRYTLVRTPSTFLGANTVCQLCYRSNLISIHSSAFNSVLQSSVSGINEGQVWIGGIWVRYQQFVWIDGSHWNYVNWAAGQPQSLAGSCVTLCTRGGRWRIAHCHRHLPFICSA